jgi:DNA-binding CsgD family transcriptional regulator
VNAVLSDAVLPEVEEFSMSPNAWVVYVSPDQIGRWRLSKSIALDDARWAIRNGRTDIARTLINAARNCHLQIMRIRRYLRSAGRPFIGHPIFRDVETGYPLERRRNQPMNQALLDELMPREKAKLSPREEEIVRLVGDGLSNPEISKRLGIARTTVTVYVSHAKTKLGAVNRAAIGEYARAQA